MAMLAITAISGAGGAAAFAASTRRDHATVTAAGSAIVATTTTPSTLPSTTTTTTAPLDARRAWSAVIAGHPGAGSSPVGPLTATAVVADGRAVFAYRFMDGHWQQRGVVNLDAEADPTTAIQVADLTGDGEDDFLVALDTPHPTAAVISAAGGQWRAVPFADRYEGTATTPYAPDPAIDRGELISDINDCEPDCADGGHYSQPWSYDSLNGDFYPNTGPGTPGGSGE